MFEGFMGVEIQCDKCGNHFKLDKTCFRTGISCSLYVEYFVCPVCCYKYPYMLADKKQLKLNRDIQGNQKGMELLRLKKKATPKSRIRLLESLQKEAKAHQAVLRDTYLQAVTDQLNKIGKETNS